MKHIIKVASLSNLPETRPIVAMDNNGNLGWKAEEPTPPGPTLLNFSEDYWGNTYYFEEGMTWNLWLARPEYNTYGWWYGPDSLGTYGVWADDSLLVNINEDLDESPTNGEVYHIEYYE